MVECSKAHLVARVVDRGPGARAGANSARAEVGERRTRDAGVRYRQHVEVDPVFETINHSLLKSLLHPDRWCHPGVCEDIVIRPYTC